MVARWPGLVTGGPLPTQAGTPWETLAQRLLDMIEKGLYPLSIVRKKLLFS